MIVTKDRSTDNKAIRQSAEAEMIRAPIVGAQGIAKKEFTERITATECGSRFTERLVLGPLRNAQRNKFHQISPR